jgi:hypothetical protein
MQRRWLRSLLRTWLARWSSDRRRAPRRPVRSRLRVEQFEDRLVLSPTTFFVTNTNDNGAGSLRQAILDANANTAGVSALTPNTIDFNVSGPGPFTINVGDNSGGGGTLNMGLPAIVTPVVIDGYSQPGASANSLATGDNANILIKLNGTNVTLGAPDTTNETLSGLDVASGGSKIRGLSIVKFIGNGILLETSGGNSVTGNFIGTDTTGAAAGRGNATNAGTAGVSIQSTSSNTVGGTTPDLRNVISGNTGDGILIQDASGNADQNVIQGNYIGTDLTGTVGLANGAQAGTVANAGNGTGGVYLDGSVGIGAFELNNNTIGGTTAGAGNLISGNATDGVQIFSTAGNPTAGNTVAGNIIGLNATGTAAILSTVAGKNITGNGRDGVHIEGASGNTVGGEDAGNVISGNSIDGVHVVGTLTDPADANVIQDNLVGVNAAGTGSVGTRTGLSFVPVLTGTADGNVLFGIEMSGALNTSVSDNVVGFNANGVELDNGAQDNVIQGNFVGVGVDGVTPTGNVLHGIAVRSSGTRPAPLGPGQTNEPGTQHNLIGGVGPGNGNTVAFNGTGGVAVFGNPAPNDPAPAPQNSGNTIEGNSIFQNGRSNPTFLLGIDLSNQFAFPKDDGVTPNDGGKDLMGNPAPHGNVADPNNFQDFPVLASATLVNGGTEIKGAFSEPGENNTTLRLEFFASNPDPAGGAPEGQFFLGSTKVTTNGSGVAAFDVILPVSGTVGQLITATATNLTADPLSPVGQPNTGNTSEFSPGVVLAAALLPPPPVVTTVGPPAVLVAAAQNPQASNVVALDLAVNDAVVQPHLVFAFWGDGTFDARFLGAGQTLLFNLGHRYSRRHRHHQNILLLVLDGHGSPLGVVVIPFDNSGKLQNSAATSGPTVSSAVGPATRIQPGALPQPLTLADAVVGGLLDGTNLTQNVRSHLNDLYVFRSPSDAFNPPPANFGNTVIIATVSPFAGVLTPASFDPNMTVNLNVDNTGDAVQDLQFQASFAPPTPTGGGNFSQVVRLTLNGTTVSTFTYMSNQSVPPTNPPPAGQSFNPPATISPLPGGGTGKFFAGNFDDPNFIDEAGLSNFLANPTNPADAFPRTKVAIGQKAGPADAKDFFGGANTLALVMEVPTTSLLKNQSTSNPNIGVWATSQVNGTQVDRMGRPLVEGLLLPPSDRTAFEQGIPSTDTARFATDMKAVLTNPNGLFQRSMSDAAALVGFLLPDVLTVDLSKPFFDMMGNPNSQVGFPNGRTLHDDVTDIELNLLTNGKGPVTDNVDDDNAGIISDGVPRKNLLTGAMQTVPVAFPYIGRPNNPAGGPNP